jgi:hypothetical protein
MAEQLEPLQIHVSLDDTFLLWIEPQCFSHFSNTTRATCFLLHSAAINQMMTSIYLTKSVFSVFNLGVEQEYV